MINVKVARDRAQRVARIKQLIDEGNNLCSKGVNHHDETTYQDLVKQGHEKLREADKLRDEFWDKYPNALIMANCPWMSRHVQHS